MPQLLFFSSRYSSRFPFWRFPIPTNGFLPVALTWKESASVDFPTFSFSKQTAVEHRDNLIDRKPQSLSANMRTGHKVERFVLVCQNV